MYRKVVEFSALCYFWAPQFALKGIFSPWTSHSGQRCLKLIRGGRRVSADGVRMGTSPLPVADLVPWDEKITPYDQAHFSRYLRLLDAVDAGAPPDEICAAILDRDAIADPVGAKKTLESHLARARWMYEQGYKDMLKLP
jgi:hypothetical protein